jgi:sugar-specific transcriptional regulator TrmB
MSNQSPYEQARFINDIIKDRADKSQRTFFSVKIESMGTTTPLVEKEQGALFFETILQYLMHYDVTALIVELYHGKAPNVKEPFQTFRIPIKRSPVILSGVEKQNDLPLTPSETIISPEKHFQTLAENQFNLLRLQYENDQLRKKIKKKKQYIEELEEALQKAEREKNKGLGNVTLGAVGANALEGFAKSQFGIALLKKVFGASDEVLQGLLGETEESTKETNSSASIVSENKALSEEEEVTKAVKKAIADYFESLNDGFLRLYYELFRLVGNDADLVRNLYISVKKYIEKKKGKSPEEDPDETTDDDPPTDPPDDS